MFYISGPKDTLIELKEREGFSGTLSEYEKLVADINPHLPKDLQQLPPYMPVLLMTLPFDPRESPKKARAISEFSLERRQKLRMMQEEGHDIIANMAIIEVLEDYQWYVLRANKNLNAPLFPSSNFDVNNSLKVKHLARIAGETFKCAADCIEKSPRTIARNELFETMKRRNELHLEVHKLAGKKTAAAKNIVKQLRKEINECNKVIQKLIPKKVDEATAKYILPNYSPKEAEKLRFNPPSAQAAKKGADVVKAINLDMLSKTGLDWFYVK